jgi:hypothetical protein
VRSVGVPAGLDVRAGVDEQQIERPLIDGLAVQMDIGVPRTRFVSMFRIRGICALATPRSPRSRPAAP